MDLNTFDQKDKHLILSTKSNIDLMKMRITYNKKTEKSIKFGSAMLIESSCSHRNQQREIV